ncbi:core protein, partial [Cymbomonas tetramitiformis]
EELKGVPPMLKGIWGVLSAWTATLLFMTMPIAQLVNNFTVPASVQGLSVVSVLLGLCGNALMIPRALYTRDAIWLTGCIWGAIVMGWTQLLSFYIAQHIGVAAFGIISALLVGYLCWLIWNDKRSRIHA